MPKVGGVSNPDTKTRNFRFALLQGTFMRINLAFADSSTVLPAFIHKLSGSDILVGLTGSMMTAGWMWPQLLMSNLLEHRPRKMPFYALGMSVRVLAWLGVFFCTITIGEQNPMLLAASFLGLYFISSSAMGVSTLPYMDIVSKSIAHRSSAPVSLACDNFMVAFSLSGLGFLFVQCLETNPNLRVYSVVLHKFSRRSRCILLVRFVVWRPTLDFRITTLFSLSVR